MQNALQYGAKRSAFWCKTQCVLVLNGRRFGAKSVQNAAKCESTSINIQCKWYKQTFSKH